jgi:hypothetical protein
MINWLVDIWYRAGELVIAAVAIVLVVIGLFVIREAARETPEQRAAAFAAWCKLHQRQDLTIEEWQTLRANYLLPGMEAKRAAEAETAAAIAIGISAGSKSLPTA